MVESNNRGGRRGGRMSKDVQCSKFLSFVLRHGAEKLGINIRADGYVLLDDILELKDAKKNKYDLEMVKRVVDNNDKKRYELKEVTEDGFTLLLIRAVQGHTIKAVESEALLTRIEDPFEYCEVIHGTYFDPLPLIMKGGLNKMARNHVHMAIGLPKQNGVISGMRASCEVVIELNMPKAMMGPHKLPFYISTNKVILSEGLKDGSIPPEYFRTVIDYKKGAFLHQAPFDYICVFDFECTCTDDKEKYPMQTQEIIEFPVVIIDVKNRKIKDIFQTYVKPRIDPQLTPFCTELTGITQEQVDAGVSLEQAIGQVHGFLHKNGLFESEFIFMSCGDFDGNHLKREATEKQMAVPSYLKRWINIKKAFPRHLFHKDAVKNDFTKVETIKNIKAQVKGMPEMLDLCKLELQGKHHSGIDDSKNIAACALKTLELDFEYTQGMVLSRPY